MSLELLIQDLLQLASRAEDDARQFAEVKGIPEPIKAGVELRLTQLKDVVRLMAHELEMLGPREKPMNISVES